MRGYFQIEHKVYGRGGEPCLVCGTPIEKITLVGRGTHFCPVCQH
jgi:formamidopyrimidine-DNA glycosylase